MKSRIIVVFALCSFLTQAQEQFILSFDKFQEVENSSTALKSQISFPIEDSVIVMGGLNDLDGMGNYLNIYGSKLLVDSKKLTSNGQHALILRREDGKDFYNLFPTLSAKLTPIAQKEFNTTSNKN